MKSVDVIEVEGKGKFWKEVVIDTKWNCYVQYGIKYVQTLSSESWKDKESINLLSYHLLPKWLPDQEQKRYVLNYAQGV